MTLNLPKTIKFIISDFDGVMTDNCIYVDNNMNISRKINFKDIMAISMLRKKGINVIFVSGEKNVIIDTLTQRFNLAESHQDIRIKINVLKDILTRYNLSQEEYLFIGDDVNDKACLEYAKYGITVLNAVDEIKSIKGIQLIEKFGGDGAFREVADCLIS